MTVISSMKIIVFDEKYRDDMIFMILSAKDALGRVPRLNADLLDIRKNYFDKGDMFWLAVDDNDRVIGSVGYSSEAGTNDVTLHRLFIKPSMKRQGIGTALLRVAEEHIRCAGKSAIYVHLGSPKEQWFESWSFYPKHGYVETASCRMMKKL